jgi:hypothetical protein
VVIRRVGKIITKRRRLTKEIVWEGFAVVGVLLVRYILPKSIRRLLSPQF